VFTEHPRDAWAAGRQHNVPMIVGYNRDEATFFTARDGAVPTTVDAYNAAIRHQFGDRADEVLALYPAKTDEEAYWADVAIRTDSRFGVSARKQLRGMFSVTGKTWAYHFSYLPEAARDSRRGVSHASELAYVFGTLPPTADQATRDVSESIMKYWTQFAKTGNPNQAGQPSWPAFARGEESYLEIGRPIHPDKDLNKAKLDLFERLQAGRPNSNSQ
jgi:para-nitrobenzyl esterase